MGGGGEILVVNFGSVVNGDLMGEGEEILVGIIH